MTKLLVLVSGRMGSGKTTLRENLLRKLADQQIGAAHYSFARPIYAAVDAAYAALAPYGIHKPQHKDRLFLQWLGTEWGRTSKGPDVWVDCAKAFIRTAGAHVVVIDDCRFPNELFADYGVPTLRVRLEADATVRRARGANITNESHSSETALDGHQQHFQLLLRTDVNSAEQVADTVLGAVLEQLK